METNTLVLGSDFDPSTSNWELYTAIEAKPIAVASDEAKYLLISSPISF
jgi:hypothetical protein